MSDMTFPQPNDENAELATANRRLTTAILGMTLLTGLIACLSYLAGRTVTHIRNETATVVRTEIPPGPVVINPLNKPSPTGAPVNAPFEKAPVSAPVTVAAVTPAAPPAPTGLYLQVGLMNPAVDRSMQDRLVQRGYSVKLVPMENSPVSRVLVGPIQGSAQQREIESKLQAEGLRFFPRRL